MFDEIQRGLAAREPAFQLFVFDTREDLFEPGARRVSHLNEVIACN